MGGDTVVALGRATVDGHALLAHNSARPFCEGQAVCHAPGKAHAADETVHTQYLKLPQVRQTFTALGHQPAGQWGYTHGVNEHHVAIGHTSWRSRLQGAKPGLTGIDLVRLGLERARSARQAVDLLTELIERHGQGMFPGCPPETADAGLVIADPTEVFALECAGSYWVTQEVKEVRAASNVGIVRQDWDRISRGLAGHVIERGWWPGDGTKIDFAGAVSASPVGEASALLRWGRATLMLEQQNGHIDTAFLRRLLSDHYEGMRSEVDPLEPSPAPTPLCRHARESVGSATVASMVVRLGGAAPMAWCAFGPPCTGVYFPIFLDGDVPWPFTRESQLAGEHFWRRIQRLHESLRRDPQHWQHARASFSFLQARIDQETDDFMAEAAALKRRDARAELQRLAGIFMQHNLEQFEAVMESVAHIGHRAEASEPRVLGPLGSTQG
jgi:dipeptidase